MRTLVTVAFDKERELAWRKPVELSVGELEVVTRDCPEIGNAQAMVIYA